MKYKYKKQNGNNFYITITNDIKKIEILFIYININILLNLYIKLFNFYY